MDYRAEDNTPDIPKGAMDTVSEDIIMKKFNDGTESEDIKSETDEVEE